MKKVRSTVTKSTLEAMARTVRLSYPEGIERGELCLRHSVNPSAWRTAGYESQLFAIAPDVYRDSGSTRYFNDPEKTALLVDLRGATDRGDAERVAELRERWESLSAIQSVQRTLAVDS